MKDAESSDRVTVQLDRDLALSFFEWSYQFMTDGNPMFQHPADAIAVDQLSAELERALPEPNRAAYPQLLADARVRALERYRALMGDKNSRWLNTLEYQLDRSDAVSMSEEPIRVELTHAAALVLDHHLSLADETDRLPPPDSAERQALWELEAALERALVEPFDPDYEELLAKAKDELRSTGGD